MKEFALAVVSVGGLVVIYVLLHFVGTVDFSDPKLDAAFWLKNVGGWLATLGAGGVAFAGVLWGLRGISSQIEAADEKQSREFQDRNDREVNAHWRDVRQAASKLLVELELQRFQIFTATWADDLKDLAADCRAEGVNPTNIVNMEIYSAERVLSHMLPLVDKMPFQVVKYLVTYSSQLHAYVDSYYLVFETSKEVEGPASDWEIFADHKIDRITDQLRLLEKRCLLLYQLVQTLIESRTEDDFAVSYNSWREDLQALLVDKKQVGSETS